MPLAAYRFAAYREPSMSPAPLRREIYVSRLYDMSRNVLFRAWTEPKHLARWWGPQDFTTPVCEIQPRVGGTLHIVMRAPDGTDYPMKGVYTEFRVPEALAFDFEAHDKQRRPALQGQVSVTFVDEGGKTRMSLSTFAEGLGAEALAMLEGMEAGWNQSLERLFRSLKS